MRSVLGSRRALVFTFGIECNVAQFSQLEAGHVLDSGGGLFEQSRVNQSVWVFHFFALSAIQTALPSPLRKTPFGGKSRGYLFAMAAIFLPMRF